MCLVLIAGWFVPKVALAATPLWQTPTAAQLVAAASRAVQSQQLAQMRWDAASAAAISANTAASQALAAAAIAKLQPASPTTKKVVKATTAAARKAVARASSASKAELKARGDLTVRTAAATVALNAAGLGGTTGGSGSVAGTSGSGITGGSGSGPGSSGSGTTGGSGSVAGTSGSGTTGGSGSGSGTSGSGTTGGSGSVAGTSGSGTLNTPPPPLIVANASAVLSVKTAARATEALAALVSPRRTQDWGGALSYRVDQWTSIIEASRDSAVLRQQLMALVSSARAAVQSDRNLYVRPMSLADISPSILSSRVAVAGDNAQVFGLAMADCSQADFVRSKGVALAVAAVYLEDGQCLTKCLDILTEMKSHSPLQRAGWTAYQPETTLPVGGDGVWLATSWGISGIVDMLSILGDRVPIQLRQDLEMLLRQEVDQIVCDWADKRPWYVKSNMSRSNQWIEPNIGLVKATLFLQDPALISAYNLGVENLAASVAGQGSDGAFMEGFGYAMMTVGSLFELLDDLRANGDLRCHDNGFVRNCWAWSLHMMMPGQRYVNSYDAGSGQLPAWAVRSPFPAMVATVLASGDTRAMHMFQGMFPDGIGTVSGVRYTAALVNLSGVSESLPRFAYFPSQAQVVWRSAWEAPGVTSPDAFALWIRGGSIADSHGHRDQGQLSVYVGNRAILMDCGTPDYATANFEQQYAAAAGHGIMQIGELTPRGKAVDAPISVDRLDDFGGRVSIDTASAYTSATTCKRTVEWSDIGTIAIHDELALKLAAPPGTEFYRFHTGSVEPVIISELAGVWTISWPGTTMTVSADRPIDVRQASWPDATSIGATHRAVLVHCLSSEAALSLRTNIVVTR